MLTASPSSGSVTIGAIALVEAFVCGASLSRALCRLGSCWLCVLGLRSPTRHVVDPGDCPRPRPSCGIEEETEREKERGRERERVCVCVFFVCVCVCVCLSLIFLLRSVVGRALSFLVRRHNDSSSVFTEEDKHKQKRGRREGKGTAGWSEKAALALLLNETPALVLVPKRLAIQNRFGLVTSVGCCFRFSHTLVQVFAHVCTKAVCRLQV